MLVLVLVTLTVVSCDVILTPFPPASQSNEEFSGSITLTSSSTGYIKGLTFAGVAPDTWIVVYNGTLNAQTAKNAIKLQLGIITNTTTSTTTCNTKLGVLPAPGIDATLELPIGYIWSQFTTIGAWCETANALFASTIIPASSSMLSTTLSTPRICPVTLPLTPFPPASQNNEQTSGSIILTSSTTARVVGLTFAGVAPDTYFVAYNNTITAGNEGNAIKISIWFIDTDKTMIQSNCNNKLGVLPAPGKEAILELPIGYTWSQFNNIGVWCFTANVLFASTSIPSTATALPRATMGTQLCPASLSLPPFPVASQSNEEFSGSITLLSSTTARINSLTFAGVAPDTYLVAYNGTLTAQNKDMAVKLQIWFERTTAITTCNKKLGVYPAPGKNGFIELPVGYTWSQFTMIGAWCFTANALFGSTSIPSSSSDLPRALTGSTACPSSTPSILIGNFGPSQSLAHGLQGKIYATSTTTLRVEGFSLDGLAPDSHFIAGRLPVGVTSISEQYGMKIFATDNCAQTPLTKYDNSIINLELPVGITIVDINFIAIWCFQARALFGSVMITSTASSNIINQLGPSYVTPTCTGTNTDIYENCEPLDSEYQVSWTVERTAGTIAFQLQAITPTQVRAAAMTGVITPFWLGFGLSGSQTGTRMIGSDITIASYDIQTENVMAIDFSLQSKSQCSTTGGVCSDVHAGGINDVTSVSGIYDSTAPQGKSVGITTIRYRRPIIPTDITLQNNATVGVVTPLDQAFTLNTLQYVVWAIGPLNIDKNPLYHYRHIPNGAGTTPLRINFGRPATNNCPVLGSSTGTTPTPTPVTDCSPRGPWIRPYIMNQTTIVARIGPVGGQAKGYAPITGQPSWGISWYLNDILIPILAVERGKTYTFIVHGGTDPKNNAAYHPFYITNSSFGGLAQASSTDVPEHVYAGGLTSAPIGTGTACDIEETTLSTMSYTVPTFQQYKQTLTFNNTCDNTSPDAIKNALIWTVPMDAPDILYYQCLLHRNLGWRIRVYNAGAVNEAELQALSTPTGAALPAACSGTSSSTGTGTETGTITSSSSSSSSTGTMTTSPNHAPHVQTTLQFVYIVLLSLCVIMFI